METTAEVVVLPMPQRPEAGPLRFSRGLLEGEVMIGTTPEGRLAYRCTGINDSYIGVELTSGLSLINYCLDLGATAEGLAARCSRESPGVINHFIRDAVVRMGPYEPPELPRSIPFADVL